MRELVGDRRRETEKEREKDTEREGGVKQMFQNYVPTMTMKTQWIVDIIRTFDFLLIEKFKNSTYFNYSTKVL